MDFKELFLKYLALYWRSLLITIVPIIMLPVFLINNTSETRCLYVVLIMFIFWLAEPIPPHITSLIPIGLFPLMGISSTANICKMYAHDTVIMFFGSNIIALAIEFCNLHKRIAMKIIYLIGFSHRRLHLGFMSVTMLISMWIPNASVVGIMSPVCMAVLQQLDYEKISPVFEAISDNECSPDQSKPPRPTRITICYLLGITYAATLGGCGTLVGTGTNLTFKGIYETTFKNGPDIDFLSFMAYSAPVMLLNTILTWVWLQFLYMGLFRPNSQDANAIDMGEEGEVLAKRMIEGHYLELGKIKSAEIQVGLLFLFTILAWHFRSSWDAFVTDSEIKDATPVIIVVILLFVLPSKWSCCDFCKNYGDRIPRDQSQALLTWNYVRLKTPWSFMFLLGGGFALAEGGNASGMTEMMGKCFASLKEIPPLGILFIACLICQILTEFCSNVAMANIILPILAELSKVIKVHPFYLMLPASLCISMSFHLSVGTPGNAIVAGLTHIRTKDMMVAGIGPSIITLFIVWGIFPVYGPLIFTEFNAFSKWTKTNDSAQF